MWYWTWICLIRCCSKVGVWYRGVFVWLGCGLHTWLLFRLFEMGAREGERGRRVLYLETRDQVEAEGATSPPISPPPNWKVFFFEFQIIGSEKQKKTPDKITIQGQRELEHEDNLWKMMSNQEVFYGHHNHSSNYNYSHNQELDSKKFSIKISDKISDAKSRT